MTQSRFKTRFAPSPTGLLHLGNVRTALFNYLLARRHGGAFLLRVEDTDATRGHEKYEQALSEDLRWLGLAWDEGPEVGGAHAPYAQSRRGTIYAEYLQTLSERGLAYPCFCTEHELVVERKTAIAAGRPPRYLGRCRTLAAAEVEARFARGMPATLRFHVADGAVVEFDDRVRGPQRFNTSDIGDFVIRRSDGTPAFFFCNAVDDALMQVTLVVRGEDHLTNTPRQILLLRALGLPVSEYAHIALVVDAAGAPLSKRTGGKSVQELRAAGYLPTAIVNYLARLGHTYDETGFMPPAALAAGFSVERLHKAPARFDEDQLRHWQREAVRHASIEELSAWIGKQDSVPLSMRAAFIEAIRGNVLFPTDAREWADRVYSDNAPYTAEARQAILATPPEFFDRALQLSATRRELQDLVAALKAETGLKGRALFEPLRAALTGTTAGPELPRLYALLGAERVAYRFDRARALKTG